jgi:hypothetical protein
VGGGLSLVAGGRRRCRALRFERELGGRDVFGNAQGTGDLRTSGLGRLRDGDGQGGSGCGRAPPSAVASEAPAAFPFACVCRRRLAISEGSMFAAALASASLRSSSFSEASSSSLPDALPATGKVCRLPANRLPALPYRAVDAARSSFALRAADARR